MTHIVMRGLMILALVVGFFTGTVLAQQSVTITDGEVQDLTPTTLQVLLTSDTPTEGVVLAIGYDSDLVSISNVDVSGQVVRSSSDLDDCDDGENSSGQTCAELVVAEIFDDERGFTLGIVFDIAVNSEGEFDGQTIPVGTDQEIASFDVTLNSLLDPLDDAVQVAFDFIDDTFNDPVLNNILVQDGDSISIVDDIDSFGGTLTIHPPDPDSMTIEGAAIRFASTGTAKVLLSNSSGEVQGFVTAIAHDGDTLSLTSIDVSDDVDDIGAEFVESTIFDDGGTLGVVLDFLPNYDGQTIPVGEDNHIADYTYRCISAPDAGSDPVSSDLEFVDGLFGTPVLDNVIVVAGLSLSPGFNNGSMSCEGPPLIDTEFHLGDRDGNELTSFPGSQNAIFLTYSDSDSDIQGMSIAMVADSGLSFVEGSFSITDSIVDLVGAEFVNENTDGDEMTIGILLDTLPPFENQTLPPTFGDRLLVGCFEVTVADDAECNAVLEIAFEDGITAGRSVPVNNVVVIDFQSFEGFETFGTTITIEFKPLFLRGDCNLDGRLNVGDPTKSLGFSFQEEQIGCEDACDVNDDGRINLADALFVLNYLFIGGAPPHAPFPEAGADDTEDELGCDDGTDPCEP